MTLATRLSTFFLAALAVILIGNSLLLYFIAQSYLYRQFDERLEASLNTLVAAIEVEDDDVKWEPTDHTVTLGDNDVEDLHWIVSDERDLIVARSTNSPRDPAIDATVESLARGTATPVEIDAWRTLRYRLAAPHPKPVSERTPIDREALEVVVARRVSTVRMTLDRLALALVALPGACWFVAAIACRWYSRQALLPVRRMAENLREVRPDDVAARLPVPDTRDELAELAVAFNGLLDRLFDAYERQRRFAGDAAHQLRTPLTVMQGQVDVALRRPRDAQEYLDTLKIVDDEIGGLCKTVETLLFLARPDDETAPPETRELDMAAWLAAYLVRWNSHPRRDDLTIDVPTQIEVRTSPDLLIQLLDTLVSNALKYSPAGTPVQIHARRDAREFNLEVQDHGPGIATEDQQTIFQPFYRTRQARQSNATGNGLGLAIAARVATALGGRLECDSIMGQGSRFRFVLPMNAVHKLIPTR